MEKYFLFLHLLLTSGLMAQERIAPIDTSGGGIRYVISPDGLNLRAQPSRRAKILQGLPFGEKVNLISPQRFGTDTVYAKHWNAEKKQVYQEPVAGSWVKVRHGQMEGYVFSAYLIWRMSETFPEDRNLNRDVVMLSPYYGCFGNFFYRPGWHWYGLCEENGAMRLKKVKPSFYVEESGMAPNLITADDVDGLQFIIGSRSPLPEKSINGQSYDFGSHLFDGNNVLNDTLLKRNNLSILSGKKDEFWTTSQLILHRGNRTQVLTAGISLGEGVWSLNWRGDIDGDQKDDYIITFGEKFARTILFLSKPAAKGQLVKPVAVFYSGYCC